MRIVILGAGTIGTSIAGLLCQNRHNVTIVDHDPAVVQEINDSMDARAVCGSAAQSSVLFQAGVMSADLVLAVTCSDECNMIATSISKAMGARRVLARVYAPVFRDLSTFDYQRHFHIDRMMSLEHLSAMELARRIREPGSMRVENFARGELEMQDVVISRESSKTGVPLRELRLPPEVRLGTINRDGDLSIATADDMIEIGDRISLIGSRGDVDDVKAMFHVERIRKQTLVIAGGGETGFHLARLLEKGRYNIVLMDADPKRCKKLASSLKHTTVVNSDACRRIDLEEERVGNADVFIACTGDDENNIMACVEAQALGAERLMAIVDRPDYANVVHKLGIDEAVSPREVVARQILGFLNTGPVVFRNPYLLGAGIEVLEVEVLEGAPASQTPLAEVALPQQCLIAAMIREDYVKVPRANDQLRTGDTIVALCKDEAVEDMLRNFRTKTDDF
jgi:trk system potassium uptake protein